MVKPKGNIFPSIKLDPTVLTAFDIIKYNIEEYPPEITEEDMEYLTMKHHEVQELIVDPELYSMTILMIRSFRRFFKFRNTVNRIIPHAVI